MRGLPSGAFDFEPDKKFILSYHFIGYVGTEQNGKVIKAVEVGAGNEVIIHFIKRGRAAGRQQMLIQYLIQHPAFLTIKYVKTLRNMDAYISEYCGWPSLPEYVQHKGPIEEASVYKIFLQLVDAVTYLHSHNVECNAIDVHNILINDKLEVKIGCLRDTAFYDRGAENAHEKNDICALGRVVTFLLAGGSHAAKCGGGEAVAFAIAHAMDSRMKESLKYIFQHKTTLELASLHNINGIDSPYSRCAADPVTVLDLLVADVLSDFGVGQAALAANINTCTKKEHFMYALCERWITEELKLAMPRAKLGASREKSSCMLYNAKERQRELLERRYGLYFNIAEHAGSWARRLFCRADSTYKLVVRMLTPLRNNLGFTVRSGCNFHEISKNAIRIMAKNVELELRIIDNRSRLLRFDWSRNGELIFNQISGTKHEFIHLTISILEGMAVKSLCG